MAQPAEDQVRGPEPALVADIDGRPVGVLEMYRRLGLEGTMIDHGFTRGRYIDAHVMARLNGATPSRGLG
jgi:hypothetical protein